MTALVGYTGFVGSNLYRKGKFDAVYNSRNIEEAYGTKPELLVYAGVRAEKYLANREPEADMQKILEAEANIEKINPRKLVLISTIDVFKDSRGADEDTIPDTEGMQPYGYNRYQLECRAREKYPDCLIVRLPGLFGANIKKNFIYDFINVIPSALKEEKLRELSLRDGTLAEYYERQDNGFYRLKAAEETDRRLLKERFLRLGFSALNFTDSRSIYQFYNLSGLWENIGTALHYGLTLWHPATEPVSAQEIYYQLTGESFDNRLPGTPAAYDYRTRYADLFGGKNGYIFNKIQILEQIEEFVKCYTV